MKVKLKKLKNQTIVITGASSGIGLVTARMAARRGARLVLASRSEGALRRLADEINRAGGEAIYVVADVGKQEEVRRIRQEAVRRFGGFDTWINDAGIGIFGKIEETPLEDMRRLFETNFWGVVYGSLEAVQVLKRRGGALINVGSSVGERVVRLQGIYSTSKHAVKGFTDALRMELEADGAPVSVTLIKPGAIDTPFPRNAKNFMEREASLPAPVYAPETVARAILHAAETPERDIIVGAGGKAIAALGQYAPRLADKIMESRSFERQQQEDGPPRKKNALDRPSEDLAERGGYKGHVAETSLYTEASLHPFVTALGVAAVGLGVAALVRSSQKENGSHVVGVRETEPRATVATDARAGESV